MLSNEYLYGREVEIPEIPADVIMRRIELLNEHLSELLKVHYANRELSRIMAIEKAIEFWSKIGEAK